MSSLDQIFEKVQQYISLKASDKTLIEACLQPQKLRKGSYYLKEGSPNRKISFVESGLLRGFYIDQSGDEITSGFYEPGGFCTDLHSFRSEQYSQRTIEAISDCELLTFGEDAQQQILSNIKDWAYFEQKYIADLLLQKVNFQRKIANSSAFEAYQLFADYYTEALRFAPRYQIASFLGISPFTLSRIKSA